MKIYSLIPAALLALLSCSKAGDPVVEQPEETFQEGQLVELTAEYPLDSDADTRVEGTLYTGDGSINFKWENGDQILVTMNKKTSTFTLTSLIDGGTSATFQGTMPDTGSNYDVQFPATEPDLTTQTYEAGKIPHNMMLATATNCSGTSFTLDPQNAVLRLNLKKSGSTILSIKKLVINDSTTPANTYTLDCSSASLGNTSTPFMVVVPPGNWNFSVDVYDSSSNIHCTFSKTTTNKYFTKGKVLNMAEKAI